MYRGDFTFYWYDTSSRSVLELHNKTQDEAMKIATEMGYKPWTWYRPSTWGNHYTCRITYRN